MPTDWKDKLKNPLEWSIADQDENAMLADLQCNILKGHGRRHTQQIFLRFERDSANLAAHREYVSKLIAAKVVSQLTQLQASAELKKLDDQTREVRKTQKNPIIAFMLSATGYDALEALNHQPQDQSFLKGMRAQRDILNDPPASEWDEHFRGEIHAMILIADSSPEFVQETRIELLANRPSGVTVLGTEIGTQQVDKDDEGVEHFGYVDGRSQPLMLIEEIKREMVTEGIVNPKDWKWNPEFPIGTALVKDPGGVHDSSHGSYFVFRKLEQNVKGFKEEEQNLANKLRLVDDEREIVGAYVIGRFEDGTPVIQSNVELRDTTHKISNNFNYDDDSKGLKCPFASHTRKTNPRGDSVRVHDVSEAEERSHIMARRGITYGARLENLSDRPERDVGLLFMAYQNNIAAQFEFTQESWVNAEGFVHSGTAGSDFPLTGLDPVIGQGIRKAQRWPREYGKGELVEFGFSRFVTMKGGEYFFAPSISMLKSL